MKATPFITGKTVDGSNNLTVLSDGYSTLTVHVTATTALAGVFEGTLDDANDSNVTADWFPLAAIIVDTGAVTKNLPGATITPDDDDVMFCAVAGCRFARFRRTAGSGTVSYSLVHLTLAEIQAATTGGAAVDTELPAAETPADNLTNATAAPRVNALNYVFDGSAWDRALGNSTDGALVNLGANNDVTTTPVGVSCHAIIPDGTDELLISASARKVYGVTVNTIDATQVYVKLYDKATAPTESDTPIWRGAVPANATAALGSGASYSFPVPIALTNGLGVRVVTGIADADDTAVTTAENYVNTFWSA